MKKRNYFLSFALFLCSLNNLSSQNYAALVAGVTSMETTGIPGAIGVITSGNSAAIAGKLNSPISIASITPSNGRMLTLAHEGFLINREISFGNNAVFATNAINWLCPANKKSILISTGHGEYVTPAAISTFSNNAISNGYSVSYPSGGFTAANLSGVGMVVIGNALTPIPQAELDALAAHLQSGGGILAIGLGWSWQSYGPDGGNLDAYPMNKVAALAGQRFVGGTNLSPITTFFPNVLPNVSNNYCVSKGNVPWTEWIANVQFGTINNASQKEGYGNFTTLTTTVAKGTSYPLSITQGFSWAADPTNQTQQGKVWIDYNQNGTFEDTELAASLTRTTATANITIPTTALTGATRMRVSLKTIGAPTACEVFEKGEVEDYSVNITGGVVIQPDLTITDVVAPSSARVNENLTFSFRFKNLGGTAVYVPNSFNPIQVVASLVGTSTTTILYIPIYKDIAAGSDSLITYNAVIPPFRATGNYTLVIEADNTNVVAESNETNNKVSVPLVINAAITDNAKLIVSNVTGATTGEPNGTIPLSITIQNTGTLPSAPDSVFIAYWRQPGFVTGYFAKMYSKNKVAVPAIAAGQSTVVNATFQLPSPLITDVLDIFNREEPYILLKSKEDLSNSNSPIPLTQVKAIGYYYPIQPATVTDLVLTGTQLNPTWDSINNKIDLKLSLTNNGTSVAKNVYVNIHTASVGNSQVGTFSPDITDFVKLSGVGDLTFQFKVTGSREENGIRYHYWILPELAAGATVEATFSGKIVGLQGPQYNTSSYKDYTVRSNIQYADVRDNNRVNDTAAAFVYRNVIVNSPSCRKAYSLRNFDGTTCVSTGLFSSTPIGMYLELLGTTLNDGFFLTTNNSTRPTNISVLWGKTIIPAQPALFSSCPGNWVYYQATGYSYAGEQISENIDTVHNNAIIRIRSIGSLNPLDQIIVEVSGRDGVFNPGSYQSISVFPKCNTCTGTDRTPPVIACPTTTVNFGPNAIKSYSARDVAFQAGITISDNCATGTIFNTGTNLRNNNDGAISAMTLIAIDTAGNQSTCNFNIKTFNANPSTYCASKSTLPWEYWIGNVSLGTINNASDKFKDFATLGYSDYTNLSTTLNKGQSYPLSISPGLSWIGNLPNAYVRVWIDFNDNKTFEANELVLEKNNTNPLTANVLVPSTAVTGNVRMRVALKFGAYPTACETFDKGEVEDYTVNITGGTVTPTCLNKFFLDIVDIPTFTCIRTTRGVRTDCGLQQYGQNIEDGFRMYLQSTNLRGDFFAKNGSTTQPVGSKFKNCSANWTYFTAQGAAVRFDAQDTNIEYPQVFMRVRTFGLATNPDSIYVELDSTLAQLPHATYLPIYFASYGKTTDCNPRCFTTDVTPPTITNCPTTVVNYTIPLPRLRTSVSSIFNTLGISSSDNCALSPNVSIRPDYYIPNIVFPEFNQLIDLKYIRYDSAGNKATCAFRIRTSNPPCSLLTSPPTITNCPANITVQAATGQSCAVATWTTPTAATSYQIPVPTLTSNYQSGFCFPVGTTTVVYTATDSCGRTATCSFNVTITGGTVSNQPDLTVTNLTVPTPSVLQGQILNFKFDLSNIGTAAATGNFNIKSYLSTDQILSANDYQDGIVPTANYAAGVSTPQVAGAMTVSSAVAAGQYYLILKADADNQITESNENNNIIVSTGLITVTGGATGGGGDLALGIISTPSVYRKFTVNTIRVTAQNVGNQALANVKVELKRPALTSNGGSKVASLGTFQDFCPGGIECSEWTIPTLAAGATATLDAPFFILDATAPIVVTTKLLSSTPTDANTANNTATVSISPAAAGAAASILALSRPKPSQFIPIVVQSIEPTMTDGNVTVRLESIVEKEVSFNIYNSMGKQIFSEKRKVEKGENLLNFDVSDFVQGMYLIAPESSFARNAPSKFIKF
jgi:GEVED domain/HYR domain/CARDB/Domain of unknown function DUF11